MTQYNSATEALQECLVIWEELARSGSSSKLAAYQRLRKDSRKDYCQCPACHYAKDVAAEKVETNFCQFCPLFDGTKYACEKKGSPYEKWLNHCGNSSDSRKAAAGEMVVLIKSRLKEDGAKVDGWIEWTGSAIAEPVHTLVDIKLRNGKVIENVLARGWRWSSIDGGRSDDIVAYRVHQPSATDVNKLVEDSKDEYIKLLEIRLKQSELELAQAKGSISSYQSKLRSVEKHYLEMKKQVADLAGKI